MRRIVIVALSTLTTLVLLFSYHTSTSSSAATSQASGAKAGSGAGNAAGGAGTTTKQGSSGSNGSGSNGSGSNGSAANGATYAGDAVPTRFGNVQVQITMSGGKITAVNVLQIPNRDRRDQQINSYAVPILNQEAVAAQSADIDMVSGATVTSVAYLQSLQSAIDKAHG